MPKMVSAPWRFARFRGSNPCSPGTSISCAHPLLLCKSCWHILQSPSEMVCTDHLSWKVSGGQAAADGLWPQGCWGLRAVPGRQPRLTLPARELPCKKAWWVRIHELMK